ncbi:MAG TPA: heparan-alpha-glucosaminide N-acetyltransferase domain-containing protein [Flavilitoribacter sp.]|nr:heparan-alpha-glucosaminide N-acetyltransferase domain-containing protein [Flavilitoribacter sp.]
MRTHTATDSVGIAQAVKPARIQFIDVLRAFAILMMLQGHFVDTTLAEQFRNPDHPVYSAWYFMRGLTAPIFFTTTGLVFVFLLLKDGRPLGENVRVRKGIRRGFMLLFWGYFLKINLFAVLSGRLYGWYFTVDVLHCIGIALLILIGVFALSRKIRMPFWILLSLLSFFAFFIDPTFKAADWSALPQPIANLFTLDYGSVFTPVPWVGYTLFGGLMGYVLHVRPKLAFTHLFPLALLVTGYLVSHYS